MPSIFHTPLPSPDELTKLIPLLPTTEHSIHEFRTACAKILCGHDPRIVLILGPCSIHDTQAALDYGIKLRELQRRVAPHVFLVMRVFLEKPRTKTGWKGLLYDPFLNGSNNLAEGLKKSRKLLMDLNELGVPCATEFLDPLVATYLSDQITWGLIGARTAASQPHRQLASGMKFPIGFKNGIYGELEPPINGIITSKRPHHHFSIDKHGKISSVETLGNPLSHLVLRGSNEKINCDPSSIQDALTQLKKLHLEERLIVDCAHGNSGKDASRQILAFELCMKQILQGRKEIRGLMLESNHHSGMQAIKEDPSKLHYGVSVTDDCLGWAETEKLASSIRITERQK